VALTIGGQPERAVGADVDGYAVRTPMIDIHSIGAGGGSLAWVDSGGVLHVGPQSAGAEPGPACYARGGDRPTTTDANLVLGFLDPAYFVGGKMALDVDRAHRAIEEHVARPLNMSIQDAAWGIRRIVDTNMAAAMRLMLSRRGLDPRDFALVPYGGAGPIHSAFLGRELGIPTTLVPRFPGTLSAFGLAISDLAHDFSTAVLRAVEKIELGEVQVGFERMEATARATLSAEGVRPDQISLARSAELRYVGQLHELTLPLPAGTIGPDALAQLLADFNQQHASLYGFSVPGEPVMLVTLRVAAVGHIERPELPRVPEGNADAGGARKPDRRVFLPESGELCAYPVYERAALRSGNRFDGPSLVEQFDSTVVVLPGQQVRVDEYGSLVIQEV
jgi:N-methylhydantoinase A